ncbi:response regulator [bacterium]|nr:response regulator [bacterium]
MELEMLVIDDDQVNNFVLKNIVQRSYPKVQMDFKLDGSSAMRYLKERDALSAPFPGVLLLDINMPVMGGFEFLDEYHERFSSKDCYIYVVSSSISKFDQQKANGYGCVRGYITKPLVNNNIHFIIEDFLDRQKRSIG